MPVRPYPNDEISQQFKQTAYLKSRKIQVYLRNQFH